MPVIVNEREWDAYMAAVEDRATKAVAEAVIDMGERIVPIAQADSPVVTGRLRDSYFFDVRARDGKISGRLRSSAPYAHLVDQRRHHEQPAKERGTEILVENLSGVLLEAS